MVRGRSKSRMVPLDGGSDEELHAFSLTARQVSRLSIYRRVLRELQDGKGANVHSHHLATLCGCTAAQVRRDLMNIGFTGSPARGYDVVQLVNAIGRVLEAPEGQKAALAGVGNLGRAILDYFATRRPSLQIVAAFDKDRQKVNRVVHGCRIHPIEDLERVVRDQGITVGVITVPAGAARGVAETMAAAGVRGFLNFAPVTIHLPSGYFIEEMDITTCMEKVAYFARSLSGQGGSVLEPVSR